MRRSSTECRCRRSLQKVQTWRLEERWPAAHRTKRYFVEGKQSYSRIVPRRARRRSSQDSLLQGARSSKQANKSIRWGIGRDIFAYRVAGACKKRNAPPNASTKERDVKGRGRADGGRPDQAPECRSAVPRRRGGRLVRRRRVVLVGGDELGCRRRSRRGHVRRPARMSVLTFFGKRARGWQWGEPRMLGGVVGINVFREKGSMSGSA